MPHAEAISDNDAKWDAQSLAEAKLIEADPSRLEAAKAATSKLADEKAIQAKAMEDVAGENNRNVRKFFPNSLELLR